MGSFPQLDLGISWEANCHYQHGSRECCTKPEANILKMGGSVLTKYLVTLGLALSATATKPVPKQPNIVFVITDDQDLHMDTLEHMPYLQKHLVKEGTSFSNHFCTIALCCPSRVNLLTGKAPHNTNVTDVAPPWVKPPPLWFDKPEYPARHAHLFKDYKIPRTSNFNPKDPSGVGWVASMPRLNQTQIEYHDEYQRCRLRALQSVDEMIDSMVEKLAENDLLDNTYFIYTTDNGFHISQHRLPPGKTCGFDTDIRIPMIVRGPGVAKGATNDDVSSHTDMAPTFLALAGQEREGLDGVPISFTKTHGKPRKTEHAAVEFWGVGRTEGIYDPFYQNEFKLPDGNYGNNTYKGIRLVGNDYSLYYSVWCSNEKEYYDVSTDPGQIKNLAADPVLASKHKIRGRPYEQIVNRLDALMMVIKSCKGNECVEPWKSLHPEGNVSSLKDALHHRYDDFYEKQPKVSFSSCELGYIKEAEGPQVANVYKGRHPHDKREPEYGGHWSYWV
ncbi:arylsulfatase [Coccidioides immitis RMSCC 3703]|uniref:Arylsulfatase n=1 Tax=Coccidioides immitis RMSCC 3703 TaxID=454286 RepID=A0A0J8RB82_COCIT|nr:arylsulfatase [Coccidioides immitis RMSCC 3703]